MSLSRKTANRILFSSLFCFLIITADAFGVGNYYILKKGNLARDEGRINDAIFHYSSYIASHPTVLGLNSSQYHANKQYYIRNLLIAYTNLINLYKTQNKSSEIDICISQLKIYNSTDELGAKNKYKLALIFQKNNFIPDATLTFEQIIEEQKNNYLLFNNKVTLRSIAKLLKIYQSQGKNDQVLETVEMIRSDFPIFDFDFKDQYKLASIYINYGFSQSGILLLEKIITEQKGISDLSEINTIIKTYSKLLKLYFNKQDNERLEILYTSVSTAYPPAVLSASNLYQVATAYLNCGKKTQGMVLLDNLRSNYSYSVFGRKALFLLGRLSQSNENWNAAIKYYSEYINKYPDPPFFSLKAYSRLIDSYWSSKTNKDLVQNEIESLAAIVNNMSDFETQLNLARDLKWKGMDELAEATFDIGLFSARTFISNSPEPYRVLRAYWMIEKYAYFMERFFLVEESAATIFELISNINDPQLNEKEKINYIENQTILWLAKMNIDLDRFDKAKSYLKIFLEKYSLHQEADYVRYEYAKILEMQKNTEHALIQYKMIESDMWKKKAEERISGITANEE